MRRVEPPYFGLARFGREWVPSIHFTRSRERGEFLRLAEWLCGEYGGEVVDRYGGVEPDRKEYWTIRVGEANWLLMRCYYPRGISLGTDRPDDLPAFEAIARAVGARPVGWRYRSVGDTGGESSGIGFSEQIRARPRQAAPGALW